jgi:hypothetical protein
VQQIGLALAAEDERVPHCVTGEGRRAVAATEGPPFDIDVVATVELAQQGFQVARGSGSRLCERRDVNRGANHSASA